jgi:hypothetical protein
MVQIKVEKKKEKKEEWISLVSFLERLGGKCLPVGPSHKSQIAAQRSLFPALPPAGATCLESRTQVGQGEKVRQEVGRR